MDEASRLRAQDDEWVRRAQRGDRLAMRGIYNAHSQRVFRVAAKIVGNQDAEEVVQETFLRAYKSIHTFRQDAALTTWLHRIAVNCSLTLARKRSRRKEINFDQEIGEFLVEGSVFDKKEQTETERRMLRRTLEAALQKLSPGYRACVVLHDIEGFSHEEIASILGCSVGTSKSQLHKARKKMRMALGSSR